MLLPRPYTRLQLGSPLNVRSRLKAFYSALAALHGRDHATHNLSVLWIVYVWTCHLCYYVLYVQNACDVLPMVPLVYVFRICGLSIMCPVLLKGAEECVRQPPVQ